MSPFGLAFGAVSVNAGLSVMQTCLLSLLLFSGASQFALVSIIGSGGGMGSALSTALLLGIRNGLYGMRVRELVRPRGVQRLLAAQFTIDESTAMAIAEAPRGHAVRAFWTTGLSIYILWNLSTVVGALLGTGLGSPSSAGLDAAGPATFVALLGPRLDSPHMRVVAFIAAAVALVVVPFVPAGAPVLIGAVAAVALVGLRST